MWLRANQRDIASALVLPRARALARSRARALALLRSHEAWPGPWASRRRPRSIVKALTRLHCNHESTETIG